MNLLSWISFSSLPAENSIVRIMSVVYQSWEVASGPTMGYNMSIQGNMCATADTLIPEASNYSSNTLLSPESFMKAVVAGSDVSKSLTFPNHKTYTPQDSVIRGFSSLSLHPQLQLQARSPSEDCKTTPSSELSNKSSELNCNIPLASNQRNFNCFACLAGNHMQGRVSSSSSQRSMHHDSSGFHNFEGALGSSALLSHSGSSDKQGFTSSNTCRVAPRNFLPLHDYGYFEPYDCPNAYHRPKLTLDVVVEDKPFEEYSTVAVNDDLELDAVSSTNSVSSLREPVDGSVSSDEGLHSVGESEVQSVYKGSSSFTGGGSPPRKGLSRFYAGKSRSFSCLGVAMSLRDLAKPENPYAKKRRCHVGGNVIAGRPQLPPLQKGAASISKKAMHNGKSTLALAVAMSTREVVIDVEKDDQSFVGTQRSWQRTSRSYSLSDLQRATESQVSSS